MEPLFVQLTVMLVINHRNCANWCFYTTVRCVCYGSFTCTVRTVPICAQEHDALRFEKVW